MLNVDMAHLLSGMLVNFLIFFFLASLYSQINAKHFKSINKSYLAGGVFGAIACLGMAIGIELQPGLKIDGRILIVGVSAAYGGPVSGLISSVIVSVYRIYIGGIGVYVGVAGIIGGYLTGVIFFRKLSQHPIPYSWKRLSLLGLVLTLQAQLIVPLFFPLETALILLRKVFFVGVLFLSFFCRFLRCDA